MPAEQAGPVFAPPQREDPFPEANPDWKGLSVPSLRELLTLSLPTATQTPDSPKRFSKCRQFWVLLGVQQIKAMNKPITPQVQPDLKLPH